LSGSIFSMARLTRTAQLFSCSVVQLFSCSVVQLFSCSVVQLFSCSCMRLPASGPFMMQLSNRGSETDWAEVWGRRSLGGLAGVAAWRCLAGLTRGPCDILSTARPRQARSFSSHRISNRSWRGVSNQATLLGERTARGNSQWLCFAVQRWRGGAQGLRGAGK
jgi:hypothetical protein